MEWAIELALSYNKPVAATMCMGPTGDGKVRTEDDIKMYLKVQSFLNGLSLTNDEWQLRRLQKATWQKAICQANIS